METENKEEAKNEEDRDREGDTPRGAQVEVVHMGGYVPPQEENADLTDFTPERVHLLLQLVYGDFPHYNNGSHMDGGVPDDALWQRRWRRIYAQSASWYATPSGSVGRLFMEILTAEWRGVLGRSWNSE